MLVLSDLYIIGKCEIRTSFFNCISMETYLRMLCVV
jgi:hypothetical protein